MKNKPSHISLIHEVNEFVNQTNNFDEILNGVVSKISDFFNFEVVSIYIFDETSNNLILKASKGLIITPDNPVILSANEGVTGFVYFKKEPIKAKPASKHPKYRFFPETGEEKFDNYFGIPLLLQNKCLGVLVIQRVLSNNITPAKRKLLSIIASRLSGLVEVSDKLDRLKSNKAHVKNSISFQGTGISKGYAVGRAFIYSGLLKEISINQHGKIDVHYEISRFEKALLDTENELNELITKLESETILSQNEINIFHAHLAILKDKKIVASVRKRIVKENITAEQALSEEIEKISKRFEILKEEYLKERSHDIRDLGQKILHHLTSPGTSSIPHLDLQKDTIVVAESISPSFLLALHNKNISGIITEKGGKSSHVAILSQALGIPAVSEIENIFNKINLNDLVLVDGQTGFVIVNPEESVIKEYENTEKKLNQLREDIEIKEKEIPFVSIPIQLSSNIGFSMDIQTAKKYGVEDVGLFRSEFSFMQFDSWPSIDDQIKIYENFASQFSGKVTIRTLDIGADKELPFYPMAKEENPLLGLRAIRLSLTNIKVFREQIKAILLTYKKGYSIKILIPLVSCLWEVQTVKEIIDAYCKEFEIKTPPELGIMLEVPSVFFQLEDYLEIVDFISIGTNDLIQYILSADRDSNTVAHIYSGFHPSIIRILNDIILKSDLYKKTVTICGELAGSPKGMLLLLSLGYRNFSIPPVKSPIAKYISKVVQPDLLIKIKENILTCKNTNNVDQILTNYLDLIDPILLEI